jgi:hypothetical protein
MSGEHKIRSVWKLFAAVVVAVALLAGFLWWELKSPTLVAWAPVATPPTDSPSLTPGPLASTISASRPSAHPAAETGAEICGLGRLPPSVDPADINNYVFAKTRAGRDRWEAALLNSSDLRARAIGLTLQSRPLSGSRESDVASAEARDELVQLAAGGRLLPISSATKLPRQGPSVSSRVTARRVQFNRHRYAPSVTRWLPSW